MTFFLLFRFRGPRERLFDQFITKPRKLITEDRACKSPKYNRYSRRHHQTWARKGGGGKHYCQYSISMPAGEKLESSCPKFHVGVERRRCSTGFDFGKKTNTQSTVGGGGQDRCSQPWSLRMPCSSWLVGSNSCDSWSVSWVSWTEYVLCTIHVPVDPREVIHPCPQWTPHAERATVTYFPQSSRACTVYSRPICTRYCKKTRCRLGSVRTR